MTEKAASGEMRAFWTYISAPQSPVTKATER